eukprot:COSAG01_NODE_61_length_29729_cov_196.711779_15_plen_377_part_00
MSDYLERLAIFETQFFAPYAVSSFKSRGRLYEESLSVDTRTCFQRDRDRIIHSKAFRRLKDKTQVFLANTSDHYRSRLTHTIEVAQVSRHLARLLGLNEDLAECIALAHDLGHTPFGHSGERVLNQLMKQHGGFEHNRQSRRIVDVLESKYPNFVGLNLSFEVREGLLKHRTPWDQPGETESFVSLEAQVVNLADEIAYNSHDLDDGLYSGILSEDDLDEQVPFWAEAKAVVSEQEGALSLSQRRHLIHRYLISTLINDVAVETKKRLKAKAINTLDDVQDAIGSLVGFSPAIQQKNKVLRRFLFDQFYMHQDIYRMNKQGQVAIKHLFKAYEQDNKLLPLKVRDRIKSLGVPQVLADYISGMTDSFALKEAASLG